MIIFTKIIRKIRGYTIKVINRKIKANMFSTLLQVINLIAILPIKVDSVNPSLTSQHSWVQQLKIQPSASCTQLLTQHQHKASLQNSSDTDTVFFLNCELMTNYFV